MIIAKLTRPNMQYDMNALLKSFYPPEDVVMEDITSEDGDFIADITLDGERIAYVKMADTMDEDKSAFKNELRRQIYKQLKELTGRELPWGILNGIRPTKLAVKELDCGRSSKEAEEFMKEVYLASDEKARLAVQIAERERKIISGLHTDDGYSLYIGIPFCPTTCLYCSFTSYPIGQWKNKVDEYVTCLTKEIDYIAENFKDKTLDTIYVGGGTPTTLEPDQIERLLTYVSEKLDLSYLQELTVESGRPDSITRDKLRAMKKCGVDRISVNPQTMSDKTLKFIGRHHTVAQYVEAFNTAREEGFDNINTDIILGLPGETIDDVRHTITEIEKLRPDDLTVHSLAIKRASRLQEWIRKNGLEEVKDTAEMMYIAAAGAERMGLSPYYLYRQKNMSGSLENVGFASENHAGIYNVAMMEEVQSILAIGAGTVTKRVSADGSISRCDCHKDVELYMSQIDEMIERKKRLFR